MMVTLFVKHLIRLALYTPTFKLYKKINKFKRGVKQCSSEMYFCADVV